MARSAHYTTSTATPVGIPIPGMSDLLALSVASTEAAAWFVKFYWSRSTNAAPTVGTTHPDLTVQIPTTGLVYFPSFPLNNGGLVYWWASAAAGDLDATVLTAGGDIITITFD